MTQNISDPQQRYGSAHHNHYERSPAYSQYSYKYEGESSAFSSTENTESTSTISHESTEPTESTELYGSTEETVVDPTSITDDQEDEDFDVTNQHHSLTMNCLYDKCSESFNACFNDQQCKDLLVDWQENKSLKSECLAIIPLSNTNKDNALKIQQLEEYETTSNTESTTSNTESTVSQDFESTSDDEAEFDTLYSSTEVDDNQGDDQGLQCEYPELFWDLYNCGVENYCYADQLKLAQSHQYLLSPASNESKSSTNNWTLLMVALTSGIAAVIIFEALRRLYVGMFMLHNE